MSCLLGQLCEVLYEFHVFVPFLVQAMALLLVMCCVKFEVNEMDVLAPTPSHAALLRFIRGYVAGEDVLERELATFVTESKGLVKPWILFLGRGVGADKQLKLPLRFIGAIFNGSLED